MPIEVRTPQLKKKSWALPLVETYKTKVDYFHKLELRFTKENAHLLNNITERDRLIICDEKGEALGSKDLAKRMDQWLSHSAGRVIFVVGGPFGLPEEIKKRSDLTMQLSSFVLNQEVALTVLMEQIFRCFTIIHNHPYHNE